MFIFNNDYLRGVAVEINPTAIAITAPAINPPICATLFALVKNPNNTVAATQLQHSLEYARANRYLLKKDINTINPAIPIIAPLAPAEALNGINFVVRMFPTKPVIKYTGRINLLNPIFAIIIPNTFRTTILNSICINDK